MTLGIAVPSCLPLDKAERLQAVRRFWAEFDAGIGLPVLLPGWDLNVPRPG